MIISLFPNKESKSGKAIDLDATLAQIKEGYWKEIIEPIRARYPSQEYSIDKLKLPVFTPSGLFKHARKKHLLTKHSGLIGLDVDAKDNPGIDMLAAKELVANDPHTYACFHSPSGLGFMALVKIPASEFPAWQEPVEAWTKDVEAVQKSFYTALESYYLQYFNLVTDKSCTDVSRCRFVSYDPNLSYNQDALTWEGRATPQPKKKPATAPKVREVASIATDMRYVLERAEKMIADAVDGGKHEALLKASHLCGGYVATGCLNADEVESRLCQAIEAKNNVADLELAYKTIRSGFVSGAKEPLLAPVLVKRVVGYVGANLDPSAVAFAIATEEGLDATLLEEAVAGVLEENSGVFWLIEWDERKGKGIVDIQRNRLLNWLTAQGFRASENGKEAEFFRVESNIVQEVHPITIAKHTNAYIKSLPLQIENVERSQVEEALVRAVKGCFGVETLQLLPALDGDFLVDTQYESFAFFRNCWVCTTADSITSFPYAELPAYVWKPQLQAHDFILISQDAALQSAFHGFMGHIMAGNPERLAALRRAMGYLLHGYKDIANTRAVILMDEVSGPNRSEGGTGKGLLMQAIQQMTPLVEIKAATFSFTNPFRFEEVKRNTKVVFFDEWDAIRLSLKDLFSEISSGLVVNEKHKHSYTIPFRDSPKFVFGTNQVITGEGSSFERRRVDVLLAPRYSHEFTPLDDFGERFFEVEWDSADWNRFYNLALGWVQEFLTHGLLLLKPAGLEDRIMAQKIGVYWEEFMLFVEELKEQAEGSKIWSNDEHERFIKLTGADPKRFTVRKFNELLVGLGFEKLRYKVRGADRGKWYFLWPVTPAPDVSEEEVGAVGLF